MPTSIPVVLPELGSENETLRVSCWLVDRGDRVEAGDRVVEVLLRGITFDVPAPVAGSLVRIEKPLDAEIAPGDVLGWIEMGAGESSGDAP